MFPSFFSRYNLINKIGEGSFSEVLKCENKKTGQFYAAKRLKKSYEKFEEVISTSEMQAARRVGSHPNIVGMKEFYYNITTRRVVFLFELMDMSMYEFIKLRKRGIPEKKVKQYSYQILKGLDHLHCHGFFHRDVKPENILVKISTLSNDDSESQSQQSQSQQIEIVKLADFGSIRGIYSDHPYTEYISTRWYRSPECLLSVGGYGPKMDVWAMGCVFYEMLTLTPLFAGEDEIDQLAKIHEILGTPNPRIISKLKEKSRNCCDFPKKLGIGLKQISNKLSADVVNVLQLMIQYDPDARINVRRLLDHKFFQTLRDADPCRRLPICTSTDMGDMLQQSDGDFDFYSLFNIIPEKTLNKYKSSPTTRSRSKGICSPQIGLAKQSKVDIANYKPDLKHHHNLLSNQHIVDPKQIKAWGVNPSILKSKEEGGSNYKRYKSPQHKPRQPDHDKNKFSKTTSNLPQIPNYANFLESIRAKHFLSKSFVLPPRHNFSNLKQNLPQQEPVKTSRVTKVMRSTQK